MVVAHHSCLVYNTFSRFNAAHYTASTAPVVDTIRWAPLDYFVEWNDIFFMALMFLISGLFVAPALERKGVSRFCTDRAKRLGIPFAIAVTVLMPLATIPHGVWVTMPVGAVTFIDSLPATDGQSAHLGFFGCFWHFPFLRPSRTGLLRVSGFVFRGSRHPVGAWPAFS